MNIPSESWTIEEVSLSQIDWEDRSFRLSCLRPIAALARSIEAIGLQTPPVLQKKKGEMFRIVSGFRRLQVLSRKGQRDVRCRIAPIEANEKDLLLFNFQENLDRGFNSIEQSWVLKKLTGLMDQGALIRDILPLMGLPSKKEMLDRSTSLMEISPVYWPTILEGRLFPEIIQELIQACRPQADLILALFIHFRWSFQKQKEFLRDLLELSQRKGQPPEAILITGPVSQLLSAGKGTPQQKGEEMRQFFWNQLYPVLTKTEKILAEQVAELDLDQRTRLIPPPFFEGGVYEMEIRFSNPEELKSSLERISRAVSLGKMDNLP
jgi:hypothetical protein